MNIVVISISFMNDQIRKAYKKLLIKSKTINGSPKLIICPSELYSVGDRICQGDPGKYNKKCAKLPVTILFVDVCVPLCTGRLVGVPLDAGHAIAVLGHPWHRHRPGQRGRATGLRQTCITF